MGIRVYLAHEDNYFRLGLRSLLESQADMGVAGDTADRKRAWEEVRRLCPDVAVISARMARDGDAAPGALPWLPALDCQVVLLSSQATTDHALHAFHAGARGYVLASSAGAELAEAVRTVHARQRYVSRALAAMLAQEYLRRA